MLDFAWTCLDEIKFLQCSLIYPTILHYKLVIRIGFCSWDDNVLEFYSHNKHLRMPVVLDFQFDIQLQQ